MTSHPSGKPPGTIHKEPEDYDIPIVTAPHNESPKGWQANFTEGQFIDYRHFDTLDIKPRFEFGFGLSYTTFDLTTSLSTKLLVTKPSISPNQSLKIVPGGNPDLWTDLVSASVDVSNTGAVQWATVVQLYISMPHDSVPTGRPLHVLGGSEKHI